MRNDSKKKAILVFSQETDGSTNDVIAWLMHFGIPFLRINRETDLKLIGYDIGLDGNTDVRFAIKDTEYRLSAFSACWYRRGAFPLPAAGATFQIHKANGPDVDFLTNLEAALRNDYDHLLEAIHHLAESKNTLSNFSTATNNKLIHFQQAHQCGLLVPATLVTTSKAELQGFYNAHNGKIVTKVVSNPGVGGAILAGEPVHFAVYTSPVEADWLDALPQQFYPSLFQQKIDKIFEIRCFYLAGAFYSMAIFSQADQQTSVDFRKYNKVKPNRNLPYQLPAELEGQLHQLMWKANLNNGSIDLVVTPDKKYYFLEVNPIGQFGMTSVPCNYYLEKKNCFTFNQCIMKSCIINPRLSKLIPNELASSIPVVYTLADELPPFNKKDAISKFKASHVFQSSRVKVVANFKPYSKII